MLSVGRKRLYAPSMIDRLGDFIAYEDIVVDTERLKRWNKLNQSLYFNYKTMLPGVLLSQKGDRPAMHSSVETRYPFLDEDFVALCARIHPRWKLSGLFTDKKILRRHASAFLPATITQRSKKMFRAPFGRTFFTDSSAYVDQLLSE